MFSLLLAIDKRSSLYRTLPIPPPYHLPFVGFSDYKGWFPPFFAPPRWQWSSHCPQECKFPTPLWRSTQWRLKANHFSSLLWCQFHVFSSIKTNDTQFSCGWHTLYCTTIVLKFPMDAPFVVKANYYPPFFLAPLALILAPLFVISQPVYVTRDNSKSTRNRETPVSSTGIPPGTFCTYHGDPARENSVLSQDLIHPDLRDLSSGSTS